MFVVWVIFTAMLWSRCSGSGDNNDLWRRADTLLDEIDTMYMSIARHPHEDRNATMRHNSIVTLAAYNFIRKNNSDYAERVNEAIVKTRKILNETADVIASPMRSYLVFLQSLIQQPMTDVKVSCPPSRPQAACETDLSQMRDDEEGKCNGYHKNVELYKLLSDRQHADARAEFMTILDLEGVENDEDALSFFQRKAMNPKFKNALKYVDRVGKMALYTIFPCRYPLIMF